MAVMGIDFAWTKPTAAQAKAAGAAWAAGYYSTDATKNWTHATVAEFLAAGLAVVGVWETTTTRATQGHAAGVADAQQADGERVSVGLPAIAVIHFAVDEDTDWASVAAYFAGAASILGQDHVGVYGGIRVIAGAAAAGYRYLWQTVAWSNGQWDPHATIHQEAGTLFGGNSDLDYSEVADFGQYPHPEVDMPLSPADLDAIQARVTAALHDPANRSLAVADNLWWWQHAIAGTVPASASPAAAAAIKAIHAAFEVLATEPAPTPAPKPAA